VALTGLAERFPTDPESEYVSINANNQVAVTLQENNHVVIVDLATGTVLTHWSAGTTTHTADTLEGNDIQFINQIVKARREPDAIAWTPGGRLISVAVCASSSAMRSPHPALCPTTRQRRRSTSSEPPRLPVPGQTLGPWNLSSHCRPRVL
jgi:hypothetical protein